MKTDVQQPYQKWLTRITTQKKKDKKRRRKILMIIKGKLKKTSKTKCKFHGEELLGPQASLRNTPCLPAPNHTRGEVIRPPSQIKIKNNSYSRPNSPMRPPRKFLIYFYPPTPPPPPSHQAISREKRGSLCQGVQLVEYSSNQTLDYIGV